MSLLNKISLSLALLLLAVPAVKAAESFEVVEEEIEEVASEVPKSATLEKVSESSFVQKAKDYAVSSKDKVVNFVKDHKKASIVTGLTAGALVAVTAAYRYCPSFRNGATKVKNFANNWVCTPVKNKFDSYSTKAKLGTAGGLTLGALAAYVGYNKLSKKFAAESKSE